MSWMQQLAQLKWRYGQYYLWRWRLMAGNLEFWWTFRIYEAHAVVVSCSLSRRRGGSRRIWTTSNCEVVTLEHQPSHNKYTRCLSFQQQGQTVKEAMNEYQMKGRMPWFKLKRQQRTSQHPAPRWFKREQGKAFALIATQTICAKVWCILKYEILPL